MIILETLILTGIGLLGFQFLGLRKRMVMVQVSQDILDESIAKLKNLALENNKDVESLYREILNVKKLITAVDEFRARDAKINLERFDDIQRCVLSKSDFQAYHTELQEKEKIIQESLKKIKENRMKSMKVAFGGKDDE